MSDDTSALRAIVQDCIEHIDACEKRGFDASGITYKVLDKARIALGDREAAAESIRDDITILIAAFDADLFVRNTDGDSESGWAMKFLKPIAAMARLSKYAKAREGGGEGEWSESTS